MAFKIMKRTKGEHDWCMFHFALCNYFELYITVMGYGFKISICMFDVMKKKEVS